MTKKSKIALSIVGLSTAGIAAGAIGGVAASQNAMISTSQTVGNEQQAPQAPVVDNSGNAGFVVNDNTGASNVVNKEENKAPIAANETIQTTTNANGFSVKLTSAVSRSAEDPSFLLNVEKNTNKEGAIFLINEEGEQAQQMIVKPGQLVKVGVVFSEGYADTHTVRDLLIYGKTESYRLATAQVKDHANMFTFKLPTMEEQKDKMTGENMFYGENESQIHIIPSFIVKTIGEDTNWEHGAFNGDINGYVFTFTKDMKWSELVDHIVDGQFANVDTKKPIDIFVYLNGHKLTIDSNAKVKLPAAAQKGWAVHFYNATKGMTVEKAGQIVPENKEAQMDIDGTVAFGRDVEYKYIQWEKGIKFLDLENKSWIGTISNTVKK